MSANGDGVTRKFWNWMNGIGAASLDSKTVNTVNALCCSVAQSCPTLWPHGLQQASCLLPTIIF